MLSWFASLQSSSGSCSSGSSASGGSDWTSSLYFTANAKTPGIYPAKISDEELMDYFKKVEGTEDQIIRVWIFKQNLSAWLPKVFGAWHEFTVVESTNYFWSFEKDSKGICVQRAKTRVHVKDWYRGVERTGSVTPEGRDPQKGREGDTVNDIIWWIYKENYLKRGYHATKSNCHYFASLIFEAIARQKGRRL